MWAFFFVNHDLVVHFYFVNGVISVKYFSCFSGKRIYRSSIEEMMSSDGLKLLKDVRFFFLYLPLF